MPTDREWALDVYGAFARGGNDESLFYLDIPGEPWSKSRPRFARGRTYQPRDDSEAEQALQARLVAANAPCFPGNVLVGCRFYRSNFQRIDTDNLLKHVCDAATGVLWADDSQVTFLLGEIQLDIERPRTVIVVGHHTSSLTRGADGMRECLHCERKFVASGRSTQRFCSAKCSHAARATVLTTRVCGQCGKEFQPPSSYRRLCSAECRAASVTNRNKSRGKPRSRCAQCDRELTHSRGGRCRDCWRRSPGIYAEAQR